ncbi:MAG: IS3 family transposase [Verrucomicrobiales bacterium]|nr:IS3 family transposase [Verrucomicrobiales bacterium]
MSRQNYYTRRAFRKRRLVEEDLVVGLVKGERKLQPRLGVRKLMVLVKGSLTHAGVKLGRDRFFEVLREHHLLLKRKRSESPRTTQSYHLLPVFTNVIKGGEYSHPNEVWVVDLTYIRTEEGFLFLALLTDKVSRHIVGYHCSDSLESIGCQKALEMALKQLPEGRKVIHHSDRGCQYCCHEYVAMALKREVTMSMTEVDHCAENAMAERMNGILKGEYNLDQRFKTKDQARKAVTQAIYLYGNRRPHGKLNNQFPIQVHAQGIPSSPPEAGRPTTGAPCATTGAAS